ncbi:hypothetical protein ACOSP7_016177 [Xanthoceras sorbifolium]|uniref:Glycosyltransferase n=1 Tax=Xanthoceras sorbifolium TaxID=99658 RepID=A0ABQ8HJJ6_9ROSI|nr:hypothetical protein JRO89_XS10G0188900 [Xanthoceras sorbifolium]
METKTLHRGRILMLPWLAQGHILPYFELANRLSHQNFQVHICSTPINLKFIREKSYCKFSSSIQLIDLQLPSSFSQELPPQYHTTKDLPPHLHATLMTAFDAAKPAFLEILKALKPDLLIYDLFQPWAPQLAIQLNIGAIMFLTCGAASLCFLLHYCKGSDIEFPFLEMSIPEIEFRKFNQFINSSVNGTVNKDRFLECQARSSNMILIKTSREIEAKYINYLSLLLGKQMVPVGFLVQESTNMDRDTAIMDWLSKKEPSSVVYVSFGTEYSLTEEEINEIAHGIELSLVSFIWIVRFRNGDKKTIDEALPEGFQERTGERGLIVEGWVPQAEILGHPSIGGFVSHCGWGSTLEAITSGVPIIAIPMVVDQPFNAKLVVDMGVGTAVPRENEKLIKREEVARVIKEVVMLQEGKQVRRKAKELSDRMRHKIADEEMDVVVNKLVQSFVKESS